MLQRIPMDDYSDEARQERRLRNIPVENDRRSNYQVFEPQDVHARISVLEVKIMNTDERLEDNQKTTDKLVERLDQHIQAAAARDVQMQTHLIKVSDAVMNLSATVTETNSTLKEIATMASDSHKEIIKWDTIVKTTIKIVSILSIAIGGLWTVYTYVDNKTTQHIQGK